MQAKIKFIYDEKDSTPYPFLQSVEHFGAIQFVYENSQPLFLVGLKGEVHSLELIKVMAGNVRKKVEDYRINKLEISLDLLAEHISTLKAEDTIKAFFEGWHLASYRFEHYKSESQFIDIALLYEEGYRQLEKEALKVSEAVCIARDLCNEPASNLTPTKYAQKITDIFRDTMVDVTILHEEDLCNHGFHATYQVGKGSNASSKVLLLTYHNHENNKMALVGKGVTFDTGGINLKQANDIVDMKMDMGGSAAVAGAMKLIETMKLPVHLTAIIPLVENVPSSTSYLPSDIITYQNGKTVEVGNTDAEGRLILADGLLYAQNHGAEWIADIATLTGSIGHALGLKVAGLFSNKLESLVEYKRISQETGDHIWPMPMVKEYESLLKSETADIKNVTNTPFGGAITAATFLHSFIEKDIKWYHIDMANTVKAFEVSGYYVEGASGFGVRLLTELVKKEVG
ncbi:leucyl aminopeptidase [Gracilibacillus orientalis]|uniref:Probable cytosol aminopeptidase n=1 Tax=Gracilibacillus orientalis TaxID=334253 RepID=A0A1I4JR59_9BACI|nr:leucyl aminopeptidase family protein [Gracilibacillus orientalis]SFL68964.1 leucyl aminopeptidase [Gracilibacillus orientalis]